MFTDQEVGGEGSGNQNTTVAAGFGGGDRAAELGAAAAAGSAIFESRRGPILRRRHVRWRRICRASGNPFDPKAMARAA